jgi:hypothetical protein
MAYCFAKEGVAASPRQETTGQQQDLSTMPEYKPLDEEADQVRALEGGDRGWWEQGRLGEPSLGDWENHLLLQTPDAASVIPALRTLRWS